MRMQVFYKTTKKTPNLLKNNNDFFEFFSELVLSCC